MDRKKIAHTKANQKKEQLYNFQEEQTSKKETLSVIRALNDDKGVSLMCVCLETASNYMRQKLMEIDKFTVKVGDFTKLDQKQTDPTGS